MYEVLERSGCCPHPHCPPPPPSPPSQKVWISNFYNTDLLLQISWETDFSKWFYVDLQEQGTSVLLSSLLPISTTLHMPRFGSSVVSLSMCSQCRCLMIILRMPSPNLLSSQETSAEVSSVFYNLKCPIHKNNPQTWLTLYEIIPQPWTFLSIYLVNMYAQAYVGVRRHLRCLLMSEIFMAI